jgi:hypothetical protein
MMQKQIGYQFYIYQFILSSWLFNDALCIDII